MIFIVKFYKSELLIVQIVIKEYLISNYIILILESLKVYLHNIFFNKYFLIPLLLENN